MKEFLPTFVLLFLITDPMGNLPVVGSMLRSVERARRIKVVLRECMIAYGVLLGFLFTGQWFMKALSLSTESLSIAGGLILFLIALKMLFAKTETMFGEGPASEPFIVPLAVPLIAGPSALGTVMLLASRDPSKMWIIALALTCVMALNAALLALSEPIERLLGTRALEAIERLMGLILTAIAVEMFLGGIRSFVRAL